MKKKIFATVYVIILGAVMLFADYSVKYVQESIDEYEASQPEHVMDDLISAISFAGKLTDLLEYPEIKLSIFDPEWVDLEILEEYEAKVNRVSDWSYRILSGGYSETAREYGLYGDGALLAKVTLLCESSRPVMEILTVNDWRVDKISPYLTFRSHSIAVELPKGFSVEINGVLLDENSEETEVIDNGENVIYRVENLLAIPEIYAYDTLGRSCSLTSKDGYYTADLEYYHLILPEGFTVFEDSLQVSGEKTSKGVEYRFPSIYKSLTIADRYGKQITYKNGDSVAAYELSFRIPDNFMAFVGDCYADESYVVETEELPIYGNLKTYAAELEAVLDKKSSDEQAAIEELVQQCNSFPRLLKYTMPDSLGIPEMLVIDNNYGELFPEFKEKYFEITGVSALESVPDEVLAEVNPLEYAKLWSRFMTDDINSSAKDHGVTKIRNILIPDSYLDGKAVSWSKNVDITFTSYHTSYKFVEEKMGNYIKYSDKLFSCDIYLDKVMAVQTQTFTGDVHDIMKNTIYFYKYMDSWKILALEG